MCNYYCKLLPKSTNFNQPQAEVAIDGKILLIFLHKVNEENAFIEEQ